MARKIYKKELDLCPEDVARLTMFGIRHEGCVVRLKWSGTGIDTHVTASAIEYHDGTEDTVASAVVAGWSCK